ncbi:unnamed protein product [Peronospora belbahrii]|uniref:FYVE-type domain-containing protein n=1 Tax=Peronospora belbahrii TaxID=622444 RepID=A0ABN8D9G8_9STRA|nr:unnamed protein product [Peronospora belbahrii]
MGKVRTMSRRRIHSGALVDDSWQPPSLTASERAYMIRKAKEASVALVDHAHTLDGPVQWHYTGKLRGIQMYRGEGCYDRAGTSGTEFLCGVTTMLGSIEEVANYFNQQTTEKMLAKKAEDVLDCAVLYSLAEGDSNNPFYRVSAKYQLYEGPSAFSRERDYCFLECQNTFRHASGRRGWVLSMHSIKLPNCPEMDGVVRGSMYQSGYVFVEAEKEGYMDVMHSLQINFKSTSRLPHFMLNAALKRRILSVVTISREIQTTRMGRQTLLKKKQLMPKRSRALCVNCARKFSLFVRKTRCRVCGEVVCQPCAPQVMISTKQGPVKTRVCTRCCHLSADDDYEPISTLHNSPNGAHMRRMQNVTRYSDILQDQHDHPDMYHEEDEDCLEEDDDEDGLEEQSDYSVFAQSRFTDASRNSFATSQYGSSRFESRFEGTSQFDTSSKFDESQYYDGGSSENSFVSGTSSSRWKGSSSAASSMSGRNQASSVKPADGHNYDPQASANSNFYGASNYGSDYGGSKHTLDEESVKRAGRYNAAAPIPEDEPFSRRSHKASTNRSHNSNKDYNSTKDSSYASAKSSSVKATQGTKYDLTNVSQNSDSKHASKTLSIQSLAKARSARYGIKSQFPVPPPPPPFSPPPEQHEESYEHDSPLHLGSLMMNDHQSLKDQKPKGIATRKIFTPPPLKEGRCETDRVSAKRVPQVAQNMAFNAASANRHSRVSQTSSIDSSGFGNTRASAILEQVRRNRGRTLQYSPEGDRTLAVLKSTERENLIRMREMERMQESAKEKAARRSMASNGSRIAVHATQNDASSGAGARRKKEDRRRSSRHFIAGSSLHSLRGAPPGSPPGTPPSMRGRRLPNSAPFNSQPNRSFRDNHSRRADASGDFEGSQILSNRSNTSFARSGARVSLISSGQSEDLTFRSQGPGHRITTKDSKHVNGQGLDGSQGSNKRFTSSFGNRQLDDSCALIIPESRHPDDLVFSESQLLLDKAKFSSSIAILETGESREHFAMMERFSEECSLGDSLLSEDLLSQSLSGMNEHINSMRAVAAYKLPDEEDRLSDELRGRQEEHRKRMEELNKLTANHVVGTRDRTSTLGDLHDSSVSLMGYSGNYFGDSTISSVSPASSVEIDDEEFDFGSRPFGRTKRSGTIFFALEEFEQAPDAEDSDELSEGLDDSNTSICQSEEYAEHDMIKLEDGYRSNEEFACENAERSLPAYRFSGEYVKTKHEHENESIPASYRSSEEHMSGFATPPRRSSVRIAESEHEKYSGCVTPPRSPNVESVESEHKPTNGLATPPRRASEGTTESRHEHMRATPSRRSSVESEESEYDRDTGFITSPRRSSVEYEESDYDRTSGLATPTRRSSVESVKSEHDQASDLVTLPRCLSVEVVKTDHDQNTGFATLPRRLSVEPAKIEHDQVAGFVTPPRRLSVESEESEHDQTSGIATPPRRFSVEAAAPVKSGHDQVAGFVTPPRRLSVESEESEHDQTSGIATPPRRFSVEAAAPVKSGHDQVAGFVTPPRRLSVESEESEHDQTSGIATPPRRFSVEAAAPVKSGHDQVAGFVTPPRRLSVESEESEHDQTSGIATPPRRFSVEAAAPVKSGHDQVAGFVTPPRRLSVESEESEHDQTSGIATPPRRFSVEAPAPVKSGHDQVAGFVTPPRRLSVESEESEHDQTSGIATPPRRFSVEAPAPVKSGHDQVAGFVTPPRRLSVESEESEHDQTSGIATPPRRFSVEAAAPVKSGHDQVAGFVTPPRRLSVESEKSEHDQTSGIATPPRRFSVEAAAPVKSGHDQVAGFVTPPRRLSVESEESEHDQTSGIATPPRRFSVEAAAPVKSGHDQVAGFVTPPRRLSVESEESEHDQTSGIATPPRRFSVEAAAPVKSGHDQVAGFVAPSRRLSVESEESEHDQTSGIATPPRRFSVESVESEHEPNCALHRSSAESESDCEQQTSFVTPPFRHNMESEHIQTNGFVTIPRHESVESAESKREYESESDSARLSYCSSEDSMEHERDGDLGDAAHRSGEKSVDNEHENGYEDAKSAYSSVKHQSYLEHVESAYCSNNGIELDEAVVVPKRPSNEPFVPPTNMSNFQLNSSQLIFGEGGLAVDEFIADSSRLLSNCMLYQVDENGDEGTCSPCDTSELHHLRLTSNTSEECNLLKTPLSKSRFGTDMLEHVTSPRESCMSAIDEELMNRPTNELFDMIRANRPIYNSDGSRSVEMMYDLEASHMRRMEELNCIAIDHLGNRISNLSDDMLGSAFQPGRSLYPGFRNEEKEMQWRSSDVMEEVQSKHQVDMERLRRRIRQLEEECRESIASVLTTEEMDLSEFDDDDNRPTSRGFVGRQSFNPQTSYMDRSDLSSSTISEHGTTDMPPQIDEPLPAQVLFEQIAQLTRLQQEMVEGEGDEDEEECRKRMKEQYRVLRSIKANSRQERELLSHQERGSLSEDEENWI